MPKAALSRSSSSRACRSFGEVEQRFSAGHRVGEVARERHPKGILIGFPDDLNSALKETTRLLREPGDTTLFEPAFWHGDVQVRADILRRSRGGCHVVEVKSSTEVKDYHLMDAAIQWRTIAGAGYPLKSMSIAFVGSQFACRGDGDCDGLFGEENVTRAIRPLIEQVPLWVASFQTMLAGDVPDVRTGKHCNDPFECPFIGHCSQGQSEFPVELLPRGGKLAETLHVEGCKDLRDVPGERLKSWNHLRVWRVTRSGRARSIWRFAVSSKVFRGCVFISISKLFSSRCRLGAGRGPMSNCRFSGHVTSDILMVVSSIENFSIPAAARQCARLPKA